MPTKKSLELKEFSLEDLASEIKVTETQYQKLRFDHATKGVERPLVIREMRRDLARLKSEMRSRELGGMDEKALANRSKLRARRAKQGQK